MKRIVVLLVGLAIFLGSCKSDKAKNEKVAESAVSDTNSVTSNESGKTKVVYEINDKVPQSVVWQNLLFKLSREELSKLGGKIDGMLVSDNGNKSLEDVEILLLNAEGKVVQKVRIGKDGAFSFKKLPVDDYSFILAENDPEVKAKLLNVNDDSSIPGINSFLDKKYLLANTFKKLAREDFLDEFNTLEVTLDGASQKNLDDLVLLIADENGKVVEKIVSNGRSKFVFQKLPRGNYSVLVHNGNKGLTASIRVMADDSKLPLEASTEPSVYSEPELNSIPSKAYLMKHTLRKLSREEFKKQFAKVQINLKDDNIKSWDNLVLLILDEDGKVVEKVVSNGKDHFVFEKLPQGNYTFALHNKPENLQAEVRLVDEQPVVVPETPAVKSIPGEAEFREGMESYLKFNFSKAISHFHEAESKGNPEVFNMLARIYDSGEGVHLDYGKALHYYEKGIAHGDVKANAGLGVLYLEGKGVKPDTNKAKVLFNKAFAAIQEKANEGDLYWMTRFGTLYNFGYGVPENYKEAAKWYSKAADKGYAFAQYNLGIMYENGLGVAQDYGTALKLYKKAVEQGDVDAEFKMGVMYANGYGVERDYQEALKWYTKAANAGYADAQYNIGVMHANGLGMEKNYGEAIKWYKKASDAGFPDAQYNLAVMYAKGQGVQKNNDEAVKLYKLAAKQGVEEAQKLLKKKGISWE